MRQGAGEKVAHKASGTDAGSKPPAAQDFAPGLYLVAMPIGHSGDITLRALALLSTAGCVACEDTRTTGALLARYGIRAHLTPYHDHNADRQRLVLVNRLRAGDTIALVSDAGTPLVSDPGYKLVRDCIDHNIPVTALPGASAALTALQLSGLPPDRFLFAGFLPTKTRARDIAIAELKDVPATLVIYEAPTRLAATLAALDRALAPRHAAVAREMTKMFEDVQRGTLTDLAVRYAKAEAPKGEAVIVVGPPGPKKPEEADIDAMLKDALESNSVRDAAALVAAAIGGKRRAIYSRALALTGGAAAADGKRRART
ncbi:MAG: 16S rRNA (cytidine(1402)-2'-O)-methyltransferase [Alphaproteobacteria bacterium]|nr:16S rRNA (cytidine(1402)-2'-O)-methyltransferase [Alphaproteobacteria bacterium]